MHIKRLKTSFALGCYLSAIYLNEEKIGYIRIFYNLKEIETELYKTIITFFVFILIILLLFLGILNFLLVRFYQDSIEGSFYISSKGELLKANKSFLNMLRFESFKELGEKKKNFFQHIFFDKINCSYFEETMEDNDISFGHEAEFITGDNKTIWLLLFSYRVSDLQGNIRYYECTAVDISERKMKEEAEKRLLKNIKETKEYLDNIFNSLPSILFSIDKDKRHLLPLAVIFLQFI